MIAALALKIRQRHQQSHFAFVTCSSGLRSHHPNSSRAVQAFHVQAVQNPTSLQGVQEMQDLQTCRGPCHPWHGPCPCARLPACLLQQALKASVDQPAGGSWAAVPMAWATWAVGVAGRSGSALAPGPSAPASMSDTRIHMAL